MVADPVGSCVLMSIVAECGFEVQSPQSEPNVTTQALYRIR